MFEVYSALLGPFLLVFALPVYIAAFIGFRFFILNDKKSVKGIGKLIYFEDPETPESGVEYYEFKRGLQPVVVFEYKGEDLALRADAPGYNFSEADIGKEFKIKYRNKFGFVVVIDEEDTVSKYNRQQRIKYWLIFGIATALLLFGAYSVARYGVWLFDDGYGM